MKRSFGILNVLTKLGIAGLFSFATPIAEARMVDASGVALQTQGTATGLGGTQAFYRKVASVVESATAGITVGDNGAKAVVVDENSPITDLPKTKAGVPQYDFKNVNQVLRLHIAREQHVDKSVYKLDSHGQALLEKTAPAPLDTPDLFTPVQIAALAKLRAGAPGAVAQIKQAIFAKGSNGAKISRGEFDRLVLKWRPTTLALKSYKALSADEFKFLSGLLLYQQGNQCSSAIGLFYDLSKTKEFFAEANYYMAHCSKDLGLTTDFYDHAQKVVEVQDPYYTKKIFAELGASIPDEFSQPFGVALLKAAKNKKLIQFDNERIAANVYFVFAKAATQAGRYKEALDYSAMVPSGHDKYDQAQFLHALALYQTGSKEDALKAQETLIEKLSTIKDKTEFQALVALNLGRMYFQEHNFKSAQENFLKVTKDQPLWLQSLTEMGWAQLQSGDFEGAIGNMYSIQSPYFTAVYKPESYVIRAIGYLQLCQYGDAYHTLSDLEKQYRPELNEVVDYLKTEHKNYDAVRAFIASGKANKDFNGLPSPVIREMTRQKDFLNLQEALNRQIDESEIYGKVDSEVGRQLKKAEASVTESRAKIAKLKSDLASIAKNPALEHNRGLWRANLDAEFATLNSRFFFIDLYKGARTSLVNYRKEAVNDSSARMVRTHVQLETNLQARLERIKNDLIRILDNNELLRYEVFAGAGENMRYQVAGGEKDRRVPASVIPQSKSLQWSFEGEYWEDEIGHYRSALKSNCPQGNEPKNDSRRDTASVGGAQ